MNERGLNKPKVPKQNSSLVLGTARSARLHVETRAEYRDRAQATAPRMASSDDLMRVYAETKCEVLLVAFAALGDTGGVRREFVGSSARRIIHVILSLKIRGSL